MGIKSSGQITTPEMDTLRIWEAMATTLKTHQYIQENPQAINDTIAKITNAYKLTEEEKKTRDAAVKTHKDALAALQDTQVEHATVKKQIADAKVQHEADIKASLSQHQEIIAQAKSAHDAKIKEIDDGLEIRTTVLDKREKALGIRENATADLETRQIDFTAAISAHESEKKQWESEKEEWESEYSARLEKLSQREKKYLKA